VTTSRKRVQAGPANATDDGYDSDLDIDTDYMGDDTSEEDTAAARAAAEVDYDPGDTIGKLLALINQMRACYGTIEDFFIGLCQANGIVPTPELKLWIRTQWGSLYECFRTAITLQKVGVPSCWLSNLWLI
jgi:hypothetical protein